MPTSSVGARFAAGGAEDARGSKRGNVFAASDNFANGLPPHLTRSENTQTVPLKLVAVAVLAVGAIVLAPPGFPGGTATREPGIDAVDPAWSPNGQRIAFVRQRRTGAGEFGALYLMNADGSGAVQIAADAAGLQWPTWSPDGRRIAYVSQDPSGKTGIYVISSDGSRARWIGRGFYPDWSPGGRRIAYNSVGLDSDVGDVMVMNPDGSRNVVAAESNGTTAYATPTWSPDGELLAFVVVDAPDTAGGTVPYLAYIEQVGGVVRQLSRARAGAPDWSPVGAKIAFTYSDGNRLTIRLLDVRRQRTVFLHDGSHPRWSPDGRQLVFSNEGKIYVMRADGTNVRQLTE